MKKGKEWIPALAVAGVALSLETASGRAPAAFYAQMAGAGWLGVVLSGLLLGAAAGLLCALARRSGAQDLPALLRRLPGGMGWVLPVLLAAVLLAALGMLLGEAGHIGALVLPVHHGDVYAALIALLLAAAIALSPPGALALACGGYAMLLAAFFAALLLFGRAPENMMRCAADLKLGNNIPAAILAATVHAALGAAASAPAAVRLGYKQHPLRLGLCTGLACSTLMALANGALSRQSPALLRLRYPFAALAAGWGRTGFYLSALMIFLGCVCGMAGVLFIAVPKRKNRISGEN